MKMLVTGGAGFIGSHVCDRLLRGKHEVVIMDDLTTGSMENVNKKAKFIKGDVSKKDELEKLFSNEKIDMVFHLAAQIDVRISTEEPERDAEVNIIGTINLLNAVKKYNLKKIVFSSTGGALYGEVDNPAGEEYEKDPKAPYGISKLSAEMYIKFFSENFNINYTILRYANVYGPRQSVKGEAGVVAIFAKNMLMNKESILYGFGKMNRDYVFVKDVAEANFLSIEKGDRETYNVGTGIKTSVADVFGMLKKHFSNYDKEPVLKEKRAGEITDSVISPEKIKRDYNIEFTTFEEGIKETAGFFMEKK